MTNKETQLTELGEILWHRPDLGNELIKIARYSLYYKTFVSFPSTLKIAEGVLKFAHQHGIKIQATGILQTVLDSPKNLVGYHSTKMFELSQTAEYDQQLPKKLSKDFSRFAVAGIRYAVHAQRCIIADPKADDRMTVALGAIHQMDCYPCVLICNKDKKEVWIRQIRNLLPQDVLVMDIAKANPGAPWKTIFIADITFLERDVWMLHLPRNKDAWKSALIVDDAHLFKNPQANRTRGLRALSQGLKCRYLLTDYPVDLSYKDLSELVRILGREREFGHLYSLLWKASRDPLENASKHMYSYEYQHILSILHFKLRSTCMVRRANDANLLVQERVSTIELSASFPADIDTKDIKHPLHALGIKKIYGAVQWLKSFLPNQLGKTLIFAHHNTVVQRISDELGIPAYYGKTASKKKRNKITQDFQVENGHDVLLVSNEVDMNWDLSGVTQVVFVEMPRSLRKYNELLNKVTDGQTEKQVFVYFLVSGNFLDKRGQYRIQSRGFDYDVIMDGGGVR